MKSTKYRVHLRTLTNH